jgi:tetratricopeptide (TPR) repeat protein
MSVQSKREGGYRVSDLVRMRAETETLFKMNLYLCSQQQRELYNCNKMTRSGSNQRRNAGSNFLSGKMLSLGHNINTGATAFVQRLMFRVPEKGSVAEDDFSNAQVGLSIYRFGNERAAEDNWENALLAWQNALEIFKTEFGEEHITVVKTLKKIGGAYFMLDEPRSAYESFQKSFLIQEAIMLPGDEQLALTIRKINVLLLDDKGLNIKKQGASSSQTDQAQGAELSEGKKRRTCHAKQSTGINSAHDRTSSRSCLSTNQY